MKSRWLNAAAAIALSVILCGAQSRTADDELNGVVVALQKSYPVAVDSDEINGIVVSDPWDCAAGTSQVRICKEDDTCINVVVDCDAHTLSQSGCTSDQNVSCTTHNTMQGYAACGAASVKPKGHAPPSFCTISHGVQSGKLSCESLTGDGSSTMSCKLTCRNNTEDSLKVCIPQGQCFASNNPEFQNMGCIKDKICTLRAKERVTVELTTICISKKSVKPPPVSGVNYTLRDFEQSEAKLIDRLVGVSRVLEANHFYDHLPPGEERPLTICQLAHWISKGEDSVIEKDKVSPESIRHELMTQAKLNFAELPRKQQKEIDKSCQQIYNSADLTLKTARSQRVEAIIAGKPAEISLNGH